MPVKPVIFVGLVFFCGLNVLALFSPFYGREVPVGEGEERVGWELVVYTLLIVKGQWCWAGKVPIFRFLKCIVEGVIYYAMYICKVIVLCRFFLLDKRRFQQERRK